MASLSISAAQVLRPETTLRVNRLGVGGWNVGDRLRPRDRLDDAADEMRELQRERRGEFGKVDALEPAPVRLQRRVLGGRSGRSSSIHSTGRTTVGTSCQATSTRQPMRSQLRPTEPNSPGLGFS